MSIATEVRLILNPWKATISDLDLAYLLNQSAKLGADKLAFMVEAMEVEEGRDSFGAVFLDPTRPRQAVALQERIMAVIMIGPNAADYVPNGAAKADAHDRHDVPNGILVNHASHCLGDGDFGYGNSVEYKSAIGG